jgi:sensor domain CHASE-containing protein
MSNSLRGPLKLAVLLSGIGSALLGLVVLLGWHLHVATLIQIRPNLAPMKYNTALSIFLSGTAVCCCVLERRRITPLLGGLVALIGTLCLLENLFDLNLGIDQLLFQSYLPASNGHPGRISPVTAACFLLIGSALILAGIRSTVAWRPLVIGSLAALVVSFSATSALCYLVDLPTTYGWGEFTRMAVHTAAGLGILGIAIFLIAWDEHHADPGREPRWLAVPVILAGVNASLILCFALEARQTLAIAQVAQANANSAKNQIKGHLDSHLTSLRRMAQRWDFSGRPAQAAWEADAGNYIHDFHDFQALEWVDPSYHIRWVVPLKGNEKVVNLDLTQEPRRRDAVLLAEQQHQPVITHPLQLVQGGTGLVVYTPIYVGTNFDGLIVGVFKADQLFGHILSHEVLADNAIIISDGVEELYENNLSPLPAHPEWVQDFTVKQPGVTWQIRAWPLPKTVAKLQTRLPLLVLLAGLFVTVLMAMIVRLSQVAFAHNRKLQEALAEVKTLSGLLPICGSCKQVRDDSGYWNQIETYITKHTDAAVSHGLCPECTVKQLEAAGIKVPDAMNLAAAQQKQKKKWL